VHPNTRPALRLLEKEGFSCRGYVDIFDAGPTVECLRPNIESVRHSFTASARVREHSSAQDYLISNTDFAGFRATAAKAAIDHETNHVVISPAVADALNVKNGDQLRLIAMGG
jgi:arginine N-succinyltransferase